MVRNKDYDEWKSWIGFVLILMGSLEIVGVYSTNINIKVGVALIIMMFGFLTVLMKSYDFGW